MAQVTVPLDTPLLDCPGIILRTYKKDSIWNTNRRPFKPLSEVDKVRTDLITIKGQELPYIEAKMEEVLKLLENPGGKMMIHRT